MQYDLVYMGFWPLADTAPTFADIKRRAFVGGALPLRTWVMENINIVDLWRHEFASRHYRCYAEFHPDDLSIIQLSDTYNDRYMAVKSELPHMTRVEK